MKSIQQQRWMIHGGGIAALGILGWATIGVGLGPLQAAAAEARQRSAEAESLAEDLETRTRSLEEARTRVAEVEAELADVSLRVRPVEDLNQRYADVIEVAQTSGLQVTESRAGTPTPEDWFVRVPIRLEGTGSITSVRGFLERVRTELPDVEIVAFDASRRDGAAMSVMRLAMDLSWYAASKDAGSGASP